MPIIFLFSIFLLFLGIAGALTYQLSKTGNVGFLISEKISVFSEIPEITAKLNNEEELEELLTYLEFWEGVTPENMEVPYASFVPGKLIVHIISKESFVSRFGFFDGNRWSTRAEGERDKSLHLYLGFNKELFTDEYDDFGGYADFLIIEALYGRTRRPGKGYGNDLDELREARREKEPYISLTKTK